MRMFVPLSLPLQDVIHEFCVVMGIEEKQCTAARINMISAVRHSLKRRGIYANREDSSAMEYLEEIVADDLAIHEFNAQVAVGREFHKRNDGGVEVEVDKNARKMWHRYGKFHEGNNIEMDRNKSTHRSHNDNGDGRGRGSDRGSDSRNKKDEENVWDTPGVKYLHGNQTVRDSGLRHHRDILDIVYHPLREEVSRDYVLPFGFR